MAKRKFSFIASLVIAVSICSLCAATPAQALTKSLGHKATITAEMTTKNADGSNKQTEVITYGVYNSEDTVREIVVGHKFPQADYNYYKQHAAEKGLDFDRLYNGYEGIAADYDTQYSTVYFDAAHIQPRYGWGSMKSVEKTKTYWGYCDALNVGWVKNCWKFIGNKWYYFNSHGVALDSTTQIIEGKAYTFNADCSLQGNK